MQFKVVEEIGAAPWSEVRDNLKVITLCDLQHFFAYRRLMDKPTAVFGPSWSSQKRRAFSAASCGFQRAAANSNLGLDHLLPPVLGPGRHQLFAK